MQTSIVPGGEYVAFDPTPLTAPALPPESDAAQHGRAAGVGVHCDTDVLYADRVEHVRQSRLTRWQRQPKETK